MTLVRVCFGALMLLVCAVHAMPTTNFDHFFPFWNSMLQDILKDNCSSEYADYKTGERPEGAPLSLLISPVINCILEAMPEYRKAELGASAVILGLLPTILQNLGSTPAETALLSLRRPVLAALLALGSPSVATMKTSEFMTVITDLVEHGDSRPTTISPSRWGVFTTGRRRLALSGAEYLVTMAAVANVVYLAYQLGFNAVVTFAPETIFMLPLWTFICVVIHFGGVLILYLKVRVDDRGSVAASVPQQHHRHCKDKDTVSQEEGQQPQNHPHPIDPSRNPLGGPDTLLLRHRHRRTTTTTVMTLQQELTPAAFQQPKRLRWRKDTVLVNFLIWLLSLGTLVNLIFGSMIFSSLLFFSVRDVLLIVGRYFVSTLVCRGVVRLELSGMKECTFYEKEGLLEVDDGGAECLEERACLDVEQRDAAQAVLLKSVCGHKREITGPRTALRGDVDE